MFHQIPGVIPKVRQQLIKVKKMKKNNIRKYLQYAKNGLGLEEFLRFKKNISLHDLVACYNIYMNKSAEYPDRGIIFPKTMVDLFNPLIEVRSMNYPLAHSINESRLFTECDFKYFLSILLRYGDRINKFIEYRNQYESFLLQGNILSANEIIERTENEISLSIWAIEARLRLYELNNDRVNRGKYEDLLLNRVNDERYISVRLIIESLLYKYSFTIDNKKAIDLIAKKCYSYKHYYSSKPTFNTILKYVNMLTVIIPENEVSPNRNDIGDYLSLFVNVGLIDKWVIIEQLLSRFYINSHNEHYDFSEAFIHDLHYAFSIVQSHIIQNILIAYDINICDIKMDCSNEFKYALLNNANIEALIQKKILKGEDLFDLIVAYSQYCTINKSEISPVFLIAKNIQNIFKPAQYGSKVLNDLNILDRYCRLLLNSEIGYGLIGFTENHLIQSERKAQMSRLLATLHRSHPGIETVEILRNSTNSIYYENCIHCFIYKWHYLDYYKKSLCIDNLENKMSMDGTINNCLCIKDLKSEGFEFNMNHILKSLKTSYTMEAYFINSRALIELYNWCCREGEWDNLFKLFFQTYLFSPLLNEKMKPIIIPVPIFKKYRAQYYFSAYYYITQISGGQQSIRDSDRMYNCYTSILDKYEVDVPSKLPIPTNQFDKQAWFFFLRNICSIDMLKRVHANASDEVRINERLLILAKLIEQEEYKSRFFNELQYEQSSLEKLLDNYFLLSALNIKINLVQINPELGDDKITQTYQALQELPPDYVDSRINEYRNGLTVYTNHYAKILDGMIGMHIRHAFFASEIRSVFSKYGYLDYETNHNQSITKFTKILHQILTSYSDPQKSSWMVVTTDENESGINLFISEADIKQELENTTFQCDEDLKLSYKRILDSKAEIALRTNSQKLINSLRIELDDSMRLLAGMPHFHECQADLSQTLKNIADWFIPKEMQSQSITFKTFSENMKMKYDSIIDVIFINQELGLSKLTNNMIIGIHLMFCNIVRNVEKHSRYNNAKDANLIIYIDKYNNDIIHFEFVNKVFVSETHEFQLLMDKMKAAIARIKQPDEKEATYYQETGFRKIFEGIKKYSGNTPNIMLESEDNKFECKILIDSKWIQ